MLLRRWEAHGLAHGPLPGAPNRLDDGAELAPVRPLLDPRDALQEGEEVAGALVLEDVRGDDPRHPIDSVG